MMAYKLQTSPNFKINTKKNLLAIAKPTVGIIISVLLTAVVGLPAQAQTNSVESDYLEDIEAGNDSQWNFSGTSESLSIEDEISDLEEYDLEESDSTDLKLNEESRRRNSRRGIKDYSIETEIYDY